jgi:hypothetical protein
MSGRSSFVVPGLLAVIALGLGVALVVDRAKHEAVDPERGDRLLPAFVASRVSDLTIRDGRGEEISLVRAPGEANLFRTQAGDDVEVAKLARLFAALERASPTRVVGAGSVGTVAGTLVFSSADENRASYKHTVTVGAEAPTPAGARYVQVDGGPVVVVTADVAADLTPSPALLRDRRLLPLGLPALARLEVTERGRTTLYETRDGRMYIGSSPVARVTSDALRGIFADLLADQPLPSTTEDPPINQRISVRILDDKGAEAASLLLGREGPACPEHDAVAGVVRGGKRTVACVSGEIYRVFESAYEARVDDKLAPVRSDEVHTIRIRQGGEGGTTLVHVARVAAGWSDFASGAAVALPADQVALIQRWLSGALAVSGTPTLDRLDHGPATITVSLAGALPGGSERAFTFALERAGAGWVAERGDGGSLRFLSGPALRGIVPFAGMFAPALLAGNAPTVAELRELTIACQGRPIEAVRHAGGATGAAFFFVPADGRRVDAGAVAGIVEEFSRLHADAWLPDPPPSVPALCTLSIDGSFRLSLFPGGVAALPDGRTCLLDAAEHSSVSAGSENAFLTRLQRGVADHHLVPVLSPNAIVAVRWKPDGGVEGPQEAAPIAELLVPAIAEDLSRTSRLSPLGMLTLTTRVVEGGTRDLRYRVGRTENGRLALGEATAGKPSVLGKEESKQLLALLRREPPLK